MMIWLSEICGSTESQQDPQPRSARAATGAGAVSPTVFGARSNAEAIA